MVPTASEILETIKLALQVVLEYIKWAQTPTGQKWTEQVLSDRAKWDSFWDQAATGIGKFFRGEYFK